MAGEHWFGIELRHLAALEAVAREGSFRRAAERLGYVQSAISHQIAALEGLTGKRLIERSRGTRPIALTDAGEVLLAHADAVIARMRAAQADPPLGRRREPMTLVAVAELPLVAHAPTRPRVEAHLRAAGAEPRFVLQSEASATVQALVAAGLGAALLPRLAVDEAATDTTILGLNPRDAIAPRTIALAWNRERRLRKDAAAFADTAADVCSKLGLMRTTEALDRVSPLLCA